MKLYKIAANTTEITFYRAEPVKTIERLQELCQSIGQPYPIFRAEGSTSNIGTYITPNKNTAEQYITGEAGAGEGTFGALSTIQVDLNSWANGDGGIDEAVIITNIGLAVSNKPTDPNDPYRINDRKQAFLQTFGPPVEKYLNDPIINDPKQIATWFKPEENKKLWDMANSGEHISVPPSDQYMGNAMKVLGPFAEKIRNDPEIIKYFLQNKNSSEDWIERNFRINSDGSGTKVVSVEIFDNNGNPISCQEAIEQAQQAQQAQTKKDNDFEIIENTETTNV